MEKTDISSHQTAAWKLIRRKIRGEHVPGMDLIAAIWVIEDLLLGEDEETREEETIESADSDLREALARYAHDAWSGWMRYEFSKGDFLEKPELGGRRVWAMPAWAVERWTRQMNTEYADLSEEEKHSDRVEADKILRILRSHKEIEESEKEGAEEESRPSAGVLEALTFAKSVIQSGEPWTETCERVIQGAIDKVKTEESHQPKELPAEVLQALDEATQLADIAIDWNLDEVELNGKMIRTGKLVKKFQGLYARYKS